MAPNHGTSSESRTIVSTIRAALGSALVLIIR